MRDDEDKQQYAIWYTKLEDKLNDVFTVASSYRNLWYTSTKIDLVSGAVYHHYAVASDMDKHWCIIQYIYIQDKLTNVIVVAASKGTL